MKAPAASTTPHGAYLSELFVSVQGEGARAGERHLFVRFAGCNIRCRYCDTPGSLVRTETCEITWSGGERERRLNPFAPAALAAVVERFCAEDPAIAMLALTGGEPMAQSAFIAAWLGRYGAPRPCLLETNALLPSALGDVLPHVAVVSADVKLPSNSGERSSWDAHRRFLSACGAAGKDVYVKMPVDDGTDAEEVRTAARLVRECVPDATLFVQPITDPCGGGWRATQHRLLELTALAQSEVGRTRLRPQLHKLAGIR